MKRSSQGKRMYWIPSDVLFWVDEKGRIMASNIRARTHLELGEGVVGPLLKFRKPHGDSAFMTAMRKAKSPCRVRDYTRFSCLDGLSHDPTNLARGAAMDELPPAVTQAEPAFRLLQSRFILIHDEKAYEQYFSLKQNILDVAHMGNFHQQLGRELMLKKRLRPDDWWLDQKFSGQGRTLRPALYRDVQFAFYKEFFTHERVAGKAVLDVGCGPGFYARFMAQQGAKVHGIDPNAQYIERAQQLGAGVSSLKFSVVDIGGGVGLEQLPTMKYDIILFQDAMLFYFIPHDDRPLKTVDKVLGELRRCLKKDGCLYIIEPHGFFQFTPWLGSSTRPFTILSEYRKKLYGITPSLSQLTAVLDRNGFLVRRVMEPGVAPVCKEYDERAFYFGNQFPQWWVFEVVKA